MQEKQMAAAQNNLVAAGSQGAVPRQQEFVNFKMPKDLALVSSSGIKRSLFATNAWDWGEKLSKVRLDREVDASHVFRPHLAELKNKAQFLVKRLQIWLIYASKFKYELRHEYDKILTSSFLLS